MRLDRQFFKKAACTLNVVLQGDPFVLYWSYTEDLAKNWGDKLNPYLARSLIGKSPIHRPEIFPITQIPTHYWIGSHLSRSCSRADSIIWGGGFISREIPFQFRARKLCAVRGYLSIERLSNAGVPVKDVAVGDPALLLPRIYTPSKKSQKYKLGLIPHIHDRDEPFFQQASKWEGVKIIDITGNIEEVIDEINSCQRIASSSLHGIICADAYGIPSLWIKVSDNLKGDGFKFLDYFSSVGRPELAPYTPRNEEKMHEMLSSFQSYSIDIDLDKLLSTCPLKVVL